MTDRRKAIDHLNGIRPKLSNETNRALDTVIEAAELAEKAQLRPVYYCDAEINHTCAKYACYLEGGLCRLTSNPEFAICQGEKPLRAPLL